MPTVTKRKSRKALTPEQAIYTKAEQYLLTCESIAGLNKEKDILKTELGEWYADNGGEAIGGLLTVQERTTPVKITGASGKRKEMLIEQLMQELPAGYVKEQRKLDLGRMYASIEKDPALRALLNEAGLELVQDTGLVFKAAKD